MITQTIEIVDLIKNWQIKGKPWWRMITAHGTSTRIYLFAKYWRIDYLSLCFMIFIRASIELNLQAEASQ